MEHSLEETVVLLTRTPVVLDSLLRGMPETWTLRNEGEGTWSPFDIVAHLIHAEREDWIPRARVILNHGESRPFPPFDREGNFGASRGKRIEELLDEFTEARAESLHELGELNLLTPDLARRGRHPSFGAVTLGELLATWAAHDLNHLHQVARVMAHQYREDVGPWTRFLGVMQCDGHGASA
jgi:DinB superfamily